MIITSKKPRGFTIIELLIVIVIIAILAAVTLVAYSSIQQRANNVARIANANAAVKLLSAYVATYSTYPYVASSSSCLGNGFADSNTHCWGIDSATPGTRNATLNDVELVKVGSLPNNTTPPVQVASGRALGPVYIYSPTYTLDGAPHRLFILYFLDGTNQDCGLSGVVLRSSTDTSVYQTVTTSPKNSGNNGNATMCYVAVNDP